MPENDEKIKFVHILLRIIISSSFSPILLLKFIVFNQ